jgi:hypothetical protein
MWKSATKHYCTVLGQGMTLLYKEMDVSDLTEKKTSNY